MKQSLKKHAKKLRFGLIGGINTLIDFSLLFLGTSLGLNHFVANYIATSVAFVFSFFANRSFTFRSQTKAHRQLIPFLAVTLFGLWVIQPVVMWLVLMPLDNMEPNLALLAAKLVATGVTLVWNYVLYSRLVFSR